MGKMKDLYYDLSEYQTRLLHYRKRKKLCIPVHMPEWNKISSFDINVVINFLTASNI